MKNTKLKFIRKMMKPHRPNTLIFATVALALWLSPVTGHADLFVSSFATGKIYDFTPSGSRSTFAGGWGSP